MKDQDYIDWEQEEAANKIVDHFKEVDALREPHEKHESLTEDMLREYLDIKRKADEFAKLAEAMKDKLKALVGKERGLIQRGRFAMEVKSRKGRVTTDWEQYVFDTVGEIPAGELSKYQKEGKPSMSIEVKELH